jgi:hypothetical protein
MGFILEKILEIKYPRTNCHRLKWKIIKNHLKNCMQIIINHNIKETNIETN